MILDVAPRLEPISPQKVEDHKMAGLPHHHHHLEPDGSRHVQKRHDEEQVVVTPESAPATAVPAAALVSAPMSISPPVIAQQDNTHSYNNNNNNNPSDRPGSNSSSNGSSGAEKEKAKREKAARRIQRHYRGYRSRRVLNGMGLDASTRWAEALKEARYLNATKPTSREHRRSTSEPSSKARKNWKRVSEVARRAGADNPVDITSDEEDEGENNVQQGEDGQKHKVASPPMSPELRAEKMHKKEEARKHRSKNAKMMDLQYFLEMVDTKHRYGSNLRAYHSEWMKSNTHENFFYWLDEGEGRNVQVPTVSREQLDSERVRYLSREERQDYLVKIDSEGRLCWAKNGQRITTSTEWEDSKHGIVPKQHDKDGNVAGHRQFRLHHNTHRPRTESVVSAVSSSSSSSSASSSISSGTAASDAEEEGEHYVNHDLQQAKGLNKLKQVSAATILNHLLRASVKPNTWIFVADTSFRLYVGIKQSGAFQHSSFLHGSRISAAGTLKIKDGQLRSLSPLSGHYRPPTSNFRAFVHSLRDAGVDMSRVSISKSYAVLVGLEAYVKTRRKFKHGVQHAAHGTEKVLHPEQAKKREEETRDKSKSAEKERRFLAAEEEDTKQKKKKSWLNKKIFRRLGWVVDKDEKQKQKQEGEEEEEKQKRKEEKKRVLSMPGQDVEDAIPPEGTR